MMVQAGCRALPRWVRAWAGATNPDFCWTPAASLGQQHSRRYSSIPSHSENSTRWRYAADEVVRKTVAVVKDGILSNTCGLTLNTDRPVSPAVFEEVLIHLCRKVESLKVSLRERDGHLWVADMDTPKIDFQVLEVGHLEDIMQATADTAYNMSESPLWRARMLMCPLDEPCKVPQVKDAFPHQYHIAIDLHHAINDGVSIMAIAQIFFTILDGVLDGAQINDKPVGELRDGKEARAAEAKIRDTLEKDPQRLKVLLEERYKIKTRVPLITEAFGKPQEPSPATCLLESEILDDQLLQVFNAKCKAHKVTFNSGFVGVTNVALMELVHEAGLVRHSYTISTRHPVDTRRYMSGMKSMVWGHHAVSTTQTMATPWNVRKDFWKYVGDFDTKFRGHINNMGPLVESVLDTMLHPATSDHKQKVIYDFFVTNMYSPRVKPYGSGKHVQLTNFQNHSPLTKLEYGIICVVAGFRDKVQFQLSNSSGYITKENAAKFSDKMIGVFNDIAKSAD